MKPDAPAGKSMTLPLILILVLAAVLRFAFLGSMEFWWDEFVTLGRATPDIPELLRGLMYQSPNVATDCSPPLHQLIVHFMLQLGRSEWLLKTPTVLFGLASIAFVVLLGGRLFSRRAGILSGLFCAISVFHIYYSRDIRWYSTYYACSLGGLYFLSRALSGGAWKHWVLYAVLTALSLYASYTAATFVAGEGLYIAGLTAAKALKGDRAGAKRLVFQGGVALVLMLLLYSPWIPAQYIAFLSFKGKGSRVPFVPAFLWDTLRFFLEYFFHGSFNRLWLAAPICVLGLASGFRDSGRRQGLLLVCCWALVPIVGVYTVKTEFGVSPKYVMSLFYFLAFTLGLGLDALALGLAGLPRAGLAARGYVLPCAMLALVAWANFHYPSFYQGKSFSHKAFFREAALMALPGETLLYENPGGLAVVGEWYLGEAFPSARGSFDRHYRRALLITEHDRRLSNFPNVFEAEGFTVARAGLANRSPLPVIPDPEHRFAYSDRYRNFQLFSDAWSTDNATVDLAFGGLTPADTTRTGMAVYAFDIPPGVTVRDFTVQAGAEVWRRNLPNSDGYVELLAGPSPDRLNPVGRLDVSDGPPDKNSDDYRGFYSLEKAWKIPESELGGGRLFLALKFSIGTVDGHFTVSSLEVRANCAGRTFTDREAAALAGGNLLANLPLAANPEPEGVIEPGRVAAFSADEEIFPAEPGRVGGVEAKDAFLAAHPGAQLVSSSRTADGRVYLEIYDPWLDPAFLLASGAKADLKYPSVPAGFRVHGSPQPAAIRWNGSAVALSDGQPPSSTTLLNPGKDRAVIFQPLFDFEHFSPADIDTLRDVRVKSPEPVLTCMAGTPCFATYRFRSDQPVKRLVTTVAYRIFNDKERRNWLRLSYSAEGGEFREIFGHQSVGGESWEGSAFPRVDEVILDHPALDIVIRLDMANDSCQWFSSPTLPMTFELYSSDAPAPLAAAPVVRLENVSPGGKPVTMAVFDKPCSAWERLRPGLKLTGIWRKLF